MFKSVISLTNSSQGMLNTFNNDLDKASYEAHTSLWAEDACFLNEMNYFNWNPHTPHLLQTKRFNQPIANSNSHPLCALSNIPKSVQWTGKAIPLCQEGCFI